ncbi:MAG: hypothetical protein CL878_13690 [Dehalococcoidia bacterium]|nr:hypothetical protein [Dehalococcoidia bacterium]
MWGFLTRNVTDAVDPPPVPKPKYRILTAAEVQQLLRATSDDRLRSLWAVAIATGARQGELLALQWDDVDWERSEIAVHRTLVSVTRGSVPQYGEPKTAKARRTIPLAEQSLVTLREWQAIQHEEVRTLGDNYANYNLIFSTGLGTPLRNNFVRERFKAALKHAGLPEQVRFHDLRHTAGSLMIAAGADVAAVSAVLGHANISTTLNIYAHTLPDAMRAAVEQTARMVTIA